MIITKIELQKKNKSRYNLYSDDVYLFSVTEETLIHFAIAKGQEFTDNKLEQIQEYNQLTLCLEQAYRYLRRRPHLKMELKRKLLSKNYNQNTIEQAVQKLHQKNYLNDKDFIKCFTIDEMKLKKNGPLLIKKKLIEKGARLEDVDQILNELYDEAMQIKNSQSLIYSKAEKINESNPVKYKQKLVNFLKQKGFSWQVIEYVFSQLKLKDN